MNLPRLCSAIIKQHKKETLRTNVTVSDVKTPKSPCNT